MEQKSFNKRLPKQFGDFAEMLVMYLLGKFSSIRGKLKGGHMDENSK